MNVEKAHTANSTYPKGGVSCSADTFVQAKSSVFQIKFCGKNPALRVAAKRCASCFWTEWYNLREINE